jgi:hypothetical protein
MTDIYETECLKPDPAQVEATKAEIAEFRAANPTLTKTGLAVAFVQHRGQATSAELHALLELEPDQYVSVELSSAVQNDRLAKDGKNWFLGGKPVAYQGTAAKKSEAPKPATAPAPAVFPTSTQPKPAPQAKHKPPVEIPTFLESQENAPAITTRPPRYRFAIWSDGQLEIAKQGAPAITMTMDEVGELQNFLAKIGARP